MIMKIYVKIFYLYIYILDYNYKFIIFFLFKEIYLDLLRIVLGVLKIMIIRIFIKYLC